MTAPHPHSRASLLALHQQLSAESYARAQVYSRMWQKQRRDWQIQDVMYRTRCFRDCLPLLDRVEASTP